METQKIVIFGIGAGGVSDRYFRAPVSRVTSFAWIGKNLALDTALCKGATDLPYQ